MSVPLPVIRDVESALEALTGTGSSIRRTSPVGGGCINPSARLEAEDGETFFLKWNPEASVDMFEAEADGLRALAEPGILRVPQVLGWGGAGTPMDPGWLLLEFIPSGSPGPEYGSRLGEGLARLHSSLLSGKDSGPPGHISGPPGHEPGPPGHEPGPPGHEPGPPGHEPGPPGHEPGPPGHEPGPPGHDSNRPFGWHRDNFIGSLPQENGPLTGWVSFWRDRRLAPQLEAARNRGYFGGSDGRVLDDLMDRLDQVLEGAEADGPALLHGDLWSGNYYPDPEGNPVIIDPAVYAGVGEVDLAMMELFGSLPRGFRTAYDAVRSLAPEYDAFRRDLYQLYYLLVHVNLFGGGYVGGSVRAASQALRGA